MKHEINVPEGCKVVSVETTDEMVVVKFEKEEPEFKENDIVKINNNSLITIVKCSDCIYGLKHKVYYDVDRNFLYLKESTTSHNARLATDSEKQLLFDKLKEKCLMFDGENVVRWRAKNGEKYYCVFSNGMLGSIVERRTRDEDDDRYSIGNYFPTREMAEAFQKVYIESLNNFHKNL